MIELDYSTIIKNDHWSDLLLSLGQYSEEQYQFALPLTYQQFWETCPKGEWLLHWIAKEGNTDLKLIVHAACQCARLTLPYCTDKQQRPLKAIETTERLIRGEATLEEVKQAKDAAAWTGSNAPYVSSAAYAAVSSAAFAAAASVASAAVSAYAAAYYVSSAAYYDAPKNQEAARQSMQLQIADLIRSLIPRPDKMVKEYERILKMRAFL